MTDTIITDRWLQGRLAPADAALFEARLLISSDLRDTVREQQYVYGLVKAYGRQNLKQEIEAIHRRLFTEKRFSTFKKHIDKLFKK